MAPKNSNKNNNNNKPRSPISAYNIFFQSERQRLLQGSNGTRPNFRNLAKFVSSKWKQMDESSKIEYIQRANDDKKRYAQELVEWHKRQEQLNLVVEEPVVDEQPLCLGKQLPGFQAPPPPPITVTPGIFFSSTMQQETPHQYQQAIVSPVQASLPHRVSPTSIPPHGCPLPLLPVEGSFSENDSHSTVGSLSWVANELGQDGVKMLVGLFSNEM